MERPLALRFAAGELPDCYDRVAGFFRHKGAYARFKALLDAEEALERWHSYEAAATEKALRAWCADNSIPIAQGNANPASL